MKRISEFAEAEPSHHPIRMEGDTNKGTLIYLANRRIYGFCRIVGIYTLK